MRRSTLLPLTALLLAGSVALPALADEGKCKAVPKEGWLSADAIRSKAEGMGLKVRKVQEEDGCWEVYALTADGKRAEIYLDPATGEVVSRDVED